MKEPLPNRTRTWCQSAYRGLVSGLAVALSTGVTVGISSVPHINIAVRGLSGAVIGSLIIGVVFGPIGGLLACRRNTSPFIGGAILSATITACVVGYLVMTYGAGKGPG